LLAGYALNGISLLFTMIGMILACVARDAYRAHAYSGVVRVAQPAQQTVVVMPPSGMAMVSAGYPYAPTQYGAPPYAQPGYGGQQQQQALPPYAAQSYLPQQPVMMPSNDI